MITPEPCLNCTCKKGVLLCLLRVCPSLVHQHVGDTCVTTRDPGQCCPTIRCRNKPPITLDTLIPETDGNTDGLDIPPVTSGPLSSNEMDKQGRTEETISLTLPMAPQSSNSLSSGKWTFQFHLFSHFSLRIIYLSASVSRKIFVRTLSRQILFSILPNLSSFPDCQIKYH